MSTKIEWATETWNPTTGCTKVSPGCANCYIERAAPMRIAGRRFVRGKIPIEVHEDRLMAPIHWREPRRVFVDSMSDLFHEDIPIEFLIQVWMVMSMCQHHQFLVLTKRPKRMRDFLAALAPCFAADFWPLPNVWLGATAENQRMLDERAPWLLRSPAAVRFLSLEPLLAPLNLRVRSDPRQCLHCGDIHVAGAAPYDHPYRTDGIDWVIVGGESGPRRRPMDLAWARGIRDQCRAGGIAFFMKQLGGTRAGTPLEELPEDLQIREYPR